MTIDYYCVVTFRHAHYDIVPSSSLRLTRSYYKNVRKEWASLVSTPPYARFQDALAFTRSLGDLHLHTYGVTHLPEVQRIDLGPIFQRLREHHEAAKAAQATNGGETSTATGASEAKGGTEEQPSPSAVAASAAASNKSAVLDALSGSTLCLVLATDGVWDNWLYEDVTRFVLDSSCLCAVGASPEGGRRVTMSFMQRNATYSKRNFGGQADNATGIVMYLSTAPSFPSV